MNKKWGADMPYSFRERNVVRRLKPIIFETLARKPSQSGCGDDRVLIRPVTLRRPNLLSSTASISGPKLAVASNVSGKSIEWRASHH